MNMETVKQFIQLQKELTAEGVIAVDMYDNSFQVKAKTIASMPELTFSNRDSQDYPYKFSAEINGIKFFSILSVEELENHQELMQVVYAKSDVFTIYEGVESEEEYLPFADEDFLTDEITKEAI